MHEMFDMPPPEMMHHPFPPHHMHPMHPMPHMLPPAARPLKKRKPVVRAPKVAAGLKLPSSTEDFEKWVYAKVISVGTGTKCIGGEYISGTILEWKKCITRSHDVLVLIRQFMTRPNTRHMMRIAGV